MASVEHKKPAEEDIPKFHFDYDTALHLENHGKEGWWVASTDGWLYGFTEHYHRTDQGKFQWDRRFLPSVLQQERLKYWKRRFDQGHGHIECFLDRDEKSNQVLVKWAGHPSDKASWTDVASLIKDFDDDSKESKELKDLIWKYVRTGEQGSTLLIALNKNIPTQGPKNDLAILHSAHEDRLVGDLLSSLPKDMMVDVHCLTKGPSSPKDVPFKVILAHGPPPFPLAGTKTGRIDLPNLLERAGAATKLIVPIFCHAEHKVHGNDCSKFAVKHKCSVLILEKGKTFYHEVEHFLLTLSQYWRCSLDNPKSEIDIFTFLTGSGTWYMYKPDGTVQSYELKVQPLVLPNAAVRGKRKLDLESVKNDEPAAKRQKRVPPSQRPACPNGHKKKVKIASPRVGFNKFQCRVCSAVF